MYQYLDQPVTGLDNGERFLLWAVRAWAHCRQRRLCPPRTMRPAFQAMQSLDALLPFHRAMIALERASEPQFGALPDPAIGEDEALLLVLFGDCAAGRDARALVVLGLLVPDAAAASILGHLHAAASGMGAVAQCPGALDRLFTEGRP